MKLLHRMAIALGVVSLTVSSAAAMVSPTNPGLDHGTVAPRTQVNEPTFARRLNEIQNINTGAFFSTIQAAHDDAATLTGHVLEIQVATHTEGPQVSITKGVTLRGQTGAEVILQSANTGSSGDSRGWFLINAGATGFSAEDLTFDGNGFLVYQGFRIWASDCSFDNCTFTDMQYPTYSGTAVVTINGANLSVTNSTFSQIGRNFLQFYGTGATGGIADNNTFTGKGAGDHLDYGIELGGGAVATCTNNTITNCRGVASSDGSTSAAMIITTFFGGLTIGDLSGNVLTACTGAVAGGYDAADSSVITATDNDFSGNDTYTVSNTSTTTVHDCSGNWWGSNVAATVAASLSGTVDYTPWLDVGTDTDGGTDGFQGDFSTLNVDDDSPQVGATGRVQEGVNLVTASTVNVEPGTYAETITLGSTFNGGLLSGDSGSRPNVTGGLNLGAGLDGATVENFYFTGVATSNSVVRMLGGVLNLTLDNCVIDGELVSGRHGFAGGQLEADATITNCELKDVLGWALFESRSGSGGGGSPLGTIEFAYNSIHNCNGTVVFRGDASAWTPVVNIHHNTWQTIGGNGAEVGQQWAAFEVNRALDVNINDNAVDDVNIGQWGEGQAAQFWSITDLDVHDNTFTNNEQGIKVYYVDATLGGSINNNTFSNNGEFGIVVDAGATVGSLDATCNWWATVLGPNALPGNPSPGDDLAGDITYAPWLDSSGGTCDQYGGNNVAAAPDGDCLSITNTCETVPVNFNRTDTSNARGVSVTIQLSSELMLCSGLSSIVQGTWLSAFPAQTVFQVLDNTGGSYTIDQAILGDTPVPCGETSGGQLFTLDVKAAGGDGTGTITVTNVVVRDCLNAPLPGIPGPPATITIDTGAPIAVADLTAAQQKTGNTAGQDTTGIVVSFTEPGDATVLEVYGAGYGNYPEYDDTPGAGSVPGLPSYPPAAPWVLASTGASPTTVHFADRDFYYFVMFTKDACGNVSAVSNMTAGTLNYHLGDVTDGATNGHGNNLVNTADISLLGANYGASLVASDPLGYLDVGPTADFSVDALPSTDNQVEFEDLMMFAINFGQVSRVPNPPVESAVENPQVALVCSEAPSAGEMLTAQLVLRDNRRSVKGVHTEVSYDRNLLELVSVVQGGLLGTQGVPVFFKDLASENGVVVDAAVLGRDLTLSGSGDLATLTFRVIASGAVPVLSDASLRGRDNLRAGRPIAPGVVEASREGAAVATLNLPERLELLGARPNPFGRSTEIVFRLPTPTTVSLKVYDVSGRLVRTLMDRSLAAGEHRARWDGRASDGRPASSGIYFYTFQAGGLRETHRLIHFR